MQQCKSSKRVVRFLFLMIACFITSFLYAQLKISFQFKNVITREPVNNVTVSVNGAPVAAADSMGMISVLLPAGHRSFSFSAVGYENAALSAVIKSDTIFIVELKSRNKEMEEVVVVATTRNDQSVENAPIKVEVLGKEEMEEENTIRPANIASILGDVSGVQIQQTSAVSGNSGVRIQGLDGRYTQILRDGMPLYDGFSGSFGILTIPPLDLQQIELVKGSASTLYGGGAIGGLVNMISKRPATAQESIVTLNQTSLQESDANLFLSKRYKNTGYTFFGGYTHQNPVDVNKDGFSDVPRLNSSTIHPRLFFYPKNTIVIVGYSGSFHNSKGGDMRVLEDHADATHQYFEQNNTMRHTGELVVEHLLGSRKHLYFKNTFSDFTNDYSDAQLSYKGNQLSYYSELSTLISYGNKNSFVAGVNVTGDRFRATHQNVFIPVASLSNNTVGIFAQNTWVIKGNTTLEAGLRDDIHRQYGNFFLPRVAFFNRFNKHWAARAGVGWGYKVPNPFAPWYMDDAPDKIAALPENITPERSIGYNAEVNYKKEWDKGNTVFINQAFFLTQIMDPVYGTIDAAGNLYYQNGSKEVISRGFDTYIKATVQHWELYAGYTYTVVTRNYLSGNPFMPLTPRNRAAFTIARDFDEAGLLAGIEGSYNGNQKRLDGSDTPDYLFMAVMVQKRLDSHVSLVLNCENLLNYRQGKVESLYTGPVTDPQFQPLWAPIDGRVVNLSLRLKL
ncbi:TonB-dependent receptor [Niabella ginsenosidivorans]|uniref:TonB-dependent receptor n=1 Tax=Niabella ginsenosidivorans TaxID=1176587 RepID=A0A1A9I7H3_9BACT|nr:TonB-dependent receptor [Niabella ginsenosidivorans]ANH82651.1 TonB-dependent receptor [Niabella ginsenosidivorans]